MKNKGLLILSGIILFFFIAVTTTIWYRIFYTHRNDSVSVLQVGVDLDKKAIINVKDMIPMDEEDISSVIPYEFSVKNNGDVDESYQVLLEEAMIQDDPTYQNASLLSRNQLSYELRLNDIVIRKGLLSDIKNNVLDDRIIEKNKRNHYQLRIYLNKDAYNTSWQNKYYHYKIEINEEKENN